MRLPTGEPGLATERIDHAVEVTEVTEDNRLDDVRLGWALPMGT